MGFRPRELEVLQFNLQKGLTNKEISEKLELGDGTIRNYVSSLLDKLKAKNRTELVNIAVGLGLIHS